MSDDRTASGLDEQPGDLPWLFSCEEAIQIHEVAMRKSGHPVQHCALDKLEAAMDRPRNLASYGGVTDVFELAVATASAIARSHAFTDGNKRTALGALGAFLHQYGHVFTTGRDDETVARWIERIVEAGHLSEEACDRLMGEFCGYLRTVTVVG